MQELSCLHLQHWQIGLLQASHSSPQPSHAAQHGSFMHTTAAVASPIRRPQAQLHHRLQATCRPGLSGSKILGPLDLAADSVQPASSAFFFQAVRIAQALNGQQGSTAWERAMSTVCRVHTDCLEYACMHHMEAYMDPQAYLHSLCTRSALPIAH